MTTIDLFNLGNKFLSEGNTAMAMNLWQKLVADDAFFGPAYVNMFNVYKQQGNLHLAKECVEKFLNCPVTGNTIDMIPKARQELADIEKQMNPKPPEEKK